MSEVVKIVFDIDSSDVKSSTDELKALKKITDEEVQSLDKLSATAQDAGDGFVSLRTRVKEAKEEAQKDRKSTRLNSSHIPLSRMPSSA